MAYFHTLPVFNDARGSLTLIEEFNAHLPFHVARIFCIHNPTEFSRGGHKHHKTIEAVICAVGKCTISTFIDEEPRVHHHLNRTDQCLILPPEDWRILHDFSPDAFLVVFASEIYLPEDYIRPEKDITP